MISLARQCSAATRSQRVAHSFYPIQYRGSDYFSEGSAIFPGKPNRMYSAIIKRDNVFPRTISVHLLGSQLKRNEVFTEKFVKRFLYS